MLDTNQTVDLQKIKLYNEWIYAAHVYDEGESGYHKDVTAKVVKDFVDPLELPRDARIIDLGCGPGYFLDEMLNRGYGNLTGITLTPGDIALCESKGHVVHKLDFSFLPSWEGYEDESVDFAFCRHALEHSPYPLFTLCEYNRVLKQDARIYIEMPAPNCDRGHEFNLNHYSILGERQMVALLNRTGFEVDKFTYIEFDLEMPNQAGEMTKVHEKFYCILARKDKNLNIK